MSFCLPKSWQFSSVTLEGASAIDFGQRLFSRNIQTIANQEGRLSAFLSAEGKVLETFWVIRMPAALLLLVPRSRQESLIHLIEKYHFTEAFSLKAGPPLSSRWCPSEAGGGIGKLKDSEFCGSWRGTDFVFDLEASAGEPKEIGNFDFHRIQNLIPEIDRDFDSSTLVFDLGFEELCDPAKGCYIGQEVVERVRTRGGNAPRKLASIAWNKSLPPDTVISDETGNPVGSTTGSIAEKGGEILSLGFIKRNTVVPGAKVSALASSVTGEIKSIFWAASDKIG